MNEIDKLYNEMLIRCGINPSQENNQEIINVENSEYGEGVGFERLRRITGYLVGDTNRWNNAKFSELNDREKHGI